MINFFFINILSIIIINQLKINSFKKIIYFSTLNFLIICKISDNIYQFFEFLIFLICILYIFVNFFTVRYSSIRIKILHDLQLNKKIFTEKGEESLFKEKKEKYQKGKKRSEINKGKTYNNED